MIINRKLNETPILINELRVGNVVKCPRLNTTREFVVTGIESNHKKVQLEFIGVDFSTTSKIDWETEIHVQEIVPIDQVAGVALWDLNNSVNDNLIKEFGFISEPGGFYIRELNGYGIVLKDDFYSSHSLLFTATVDRQLIMGRSVWYVHELQNSIYSITKMDIENDLISKVMTASPGNSKIRLLDSK